MRRGMSASRDERRAVKPLAVTGARRSPLLPDVPTFKECGYEGFEGLTWYGIVGPANLPPDITARLNTEINKMLAAPEFKDKLSSQALDIMPMAPEQPFAGIVWAAVVIANLPPDI